MNRCVTVNQSVLCNPLHSVLLNVADIVFATCGFRHSAVAAWNTLPDSVRDSSNADKFKC